MKKYANSNLFDALIKRMPSLADGLVKQAKYTQASVASNLYKIWLDENNQVGKKVFKKSSKISTAELSGLIASGLVKQIGDKIQITEKGSEVIKVMVLGDDRSIYEDDGKQINFKIASSNVKQTSKSKKKKVQDQFWGNIGY